MKLSKIFLTFYICILILGCSKEPEEQIVKVGYIPIADCAQLFIADIKGYFREEGIDVELIKLKGGAEILPALATGSIDVGFSNVVSVLLAAERGIPIKILTGGPITDAKHVEGAIFVSSDGDYNSIKDLVQSTIAVNTRKNIVELFVSETLIKHGVNTSNIEFIEIPFPQMYQVLRTGKVDAVASIEPFVTFSLEEGGVANLGDYFTGATERVQISTYNIVDGKNAISDESAQAFRRAILRASHFIQDARNRSVLTNAIAAYTSLDAPQAEKIGLPSYSGEIDITSLNNVKQIMLKRAWLATDIDVTEYIH